MELAIHKAFGYYDDSDVDYDTLTEEELNEELQKQKKEQVYYVFDREGNFYKLEKVEEKDVPIPIKTMEWTYKSYRDYYEYQRKQTNKGDNE